MKKSFQVFLLFLVQLSLCFAGVRLFGIYINPILYFAVSLSIAVIYFKTVIDPPHIATIAPPKVSSYTPFYLLLAALLSGCFILYFFQFRTYTDTHTYSDVIPQLDALYDRFSRGEQPYYPLPLAGYSPFPVYMPLHWLPIGIARFLNMDLRVFGMLILCVGIMIYGYTFIKRLNTTWGKILAVILPICALLGFYIFRTLDLILNFETPIAAYYLILALGLSRRNILLITVGLILCILSRYTLVFWIPLFAILLWINIPRKQSLMVWATVAMAILFIYIIPFYLRAPSALLSGIKYHNGAAVGEWSYVSGTFDLGIYFAPHMKAIFGGTMEHRVFCARIVQASVMLFLLFGGLWAYYRLRLKVNFYDFSLGMLYLVLLCFYTIGPLTYRYYLISLFFVGIILCAKVFEYKEVGVVSESPNRA